MTFTLGEGVRSLLEGGKIVLINEVEHVVGLSKKSIRFYEDNGLLKPKRKENDYREYDEKDIEKLKTIKFMRSLGVPIKELKDLESGKISLRECIEDRIHKIDMEENKFSKVKEMCNEILEKDESFGSLDIEEYSKTMNVLGKEGFTLVDESSNKRNKKFGAMMSSLIFIVLILFVPIIITYFQITESEKMPWILFIFLMIIFVMPIIGIVVNLFKRIKEIEGGEEDEASKY